jgi:SAM-dependent methyltransferase
LTDEEECGLPHALDLHLTLKELLAMQNQDKWKPSRYIYKRGKLISSRDPKLNVGSRLIGDLVANYYDHNLRLHARGKLIDLGCGYVPLFAAYRDYVTDNICVDWGNTFHKNEYLDCELDLTKNLPFADLQFDTIILSDVLEHIPAPEQLWKEMARILSGNGKILMNVPFYYHLHEQPYDYYRYTEFALRRFVEMSGLRVIQLESLGGVSEVMTDIFAKNVGRLPMLGHSLAFFAQFITSVFIKTKFGKMLSKATRSSYPLGYFLIAGKPLS